MALNNATYELGERKDREIQRVDEDEGSIHAIGQSTSLSSREERDRTELMRLGKVPVLKVRSLLRPFFPRQINLESTQLTPALLSLKRSYGFMSILGFTTTILVTWEGVLMLVLPGGLLWIFML